MAMPSRGPVPPSGIRRRLGGPGHLADSDSGPHGSPGACRMSPQMSPAMSHQTPRSTAGSPLLSHASVPRMGVGDLAAGPRRHNSLSEVEILPWLCCMTPAICIFTLYLAVIITAVFFAKAFYILCAVLTFITMLWISNLALASIYGAYRTRQDTQIDWNAKLEEAQDAREDGFDVLHIVILPNFKEHEGMLLETLENLASSPMALDRVRVVLACEAREGPTVHEKANRLISKTEHLFADIFATYHPENVPGEVAGKSSNTQYAYRESLRHYGPILQGCDLSRVFVTVGDADTLWHPQYLSALTYSGMNMTGEQRSWAIWQPPILLMRNIFSVPAMTRASGHATLIFELSALANQTFFPAFAYSSYSLSLALASHPEVDGWDVDVIAEDHHMFCKCYFAALWELAHAQKDNTNTKRNGDDVVEITPQVKVVPIFLPAVSYLVESSGGYAASLWARFEQARRHSQGVVELGYVLLQYTRLTRNTGWMGLPWRTHGAIMSIVVKLHTLHITSTAQCLSLIMAFLTTIIPAVISWVTSGGIYTLFQSGASNATTQVVDGFNGLEFAQQALAASLGQVSGVSVLYSFTCFVVIKDLIEGNYYKVLGRPNIVGAMPSVGEVDETAEAAAAEATPKEVAEKAAREAEGAVDNTYRGTAALRAVVKGPLSFYQSLGLLLHILHDTVFVGYYAITFYAMIPVSLAAWSLFRRGTDFEYIVAEKPSFE